MGCTQQQLERHYDHSTSNSRRENIVKTKRTAKQPETSALTPEKGEIIHFYAVNRWDEDDVFDEYARPQRPLSPEAERILGFTNDQLAHCRTTDQVLNDSR